MSIGLTGQLGKGSLGAFELAAVSAGSLFVPHQAHVASALAGLDASSALTSLGVTSGLTDHGVRSNLSSAGAASTLSASKAQSEVE
jgi:hypothetical protein